MNLRICILINQPLSDGRYKIRIAMAHNRTTRYFVTDCCVSSPKNLKNGIITGKESGSKETNLKLQALMTKIQTAYEQIEGAEFFSCAELVSLIKERMKGAKPKTIKEILSICKERKELQGRRTNTIRIFNTTTNTIVRYFGEKKTMQSLTEEDILRFKLWMNTVEHLDNKKHEGNTPKEKRNLKPKKYGFSPSTQRAIILKLKSAYFFAIKQKYFTPDLDIWSGIEIPKGDPWRCTLSIDELRRLKDYPFSDPYDAEIRDLVMLSFYLGGMNLVDLLRLDLSLPSVSYRRIKTDKTRPKEERTEFTIQPEARSLIDRFWKNGRFTFRNGVGEAAILQALKRKLPNLQKACGIEGRLIYYSARKTFSQLCLELGVPDAVNAYCIGDVPPKSTLNVYRRANKKLADFYMRKVFDFMASDKTIEEAINEIEQ